MRGETGGDDSLADIGIGASDGTAARANHGPAMPLARARVEGLMSDCDEMASNGTIAYNAKLSALIAFVHCGIIHMLHCTTKDVEAN